MNGLNVNTIPDHFVDKILEFPIDVIEINQDINPEFSQTDLFARLNTKPYPIKENTFEMWNAYIDKDSSYNSTEQNVAKFVKAEGYTYSWPAAVKIYDNSSANFAEFKTLAEKLVATVGGNIAEYFFTTPKQPVKVTAFEVLKKKPN